MKASIIILAVFLAACGGGGSDHSGTEGNEVPAAVQHPTESFCPCIPAVPASAPTQSG